MDGRKSRYKIVLHKKETTHSVTERGAEGVLIGAIGYRAQFSANAYSCQLCQLFCCSAVLIGSVTLPAEHLVNSCES